MKWAMIVPAAAMLGACANYPYADDYARLDVLNNPHICEEGDTAGFIGQPASQGLADAVIMETGAGLFRWLRVDGMATTDMLPERVNVTLDNNNVVTRVHCG
ncbi:I78 family peptidase inhibitor [Sphingomicrobium sediminis]|uniref:I78 family peptidase inhibitor n=1 Tax=Sphingomicrobium sediminis TaxID=2950949 RepID=A0A9X2EG86_9SPHN|nr:I78 family peptidase inhibitor [Sphingomicrobium sediminis]MCM8556955.1 I78 family peptidase inhibitor [Sphingomicrobium sediminis]